MNIEQSPNPRGTIELYNLEDDIVQQENMAGHHPAVVMKIQRIMKRADVPAKVFSFKTQ